MYPVETECRVDSPSRRWLINVNWLQALTQHAEDNISCVLVTVIESAGSAPRVVGTRMVVTVDAFADTIGGGALEHEAIDHARHLLHAESHEMPISHREFTLGADLTQCCGGKVTLQFDCHWANDFTLHVFGAGHVAQEMARIVQRLPCRTTFYDSRAPWLDKLSASLESQSGAANTIVNTQLVTQNPYTLVEHCPVKSYYAIMTHSHELDMEFVEAVLTRQDALYCGLIASDSKAASFRSRLKRKGFSDAEIQGLTAPLGSHSETGNTPMEVAVATVADILHIRQRYLQEHTKAKSS